MIFPEVLKKLTEGIRSMELQYRFIKIGPKAEMSCRGPVNLALLVKRSDTESCSET